MFYISDARKIAATVLVRHLFPSAESYITSASNRQGIAAALLAVRESQWELPECGRRGADATGGDLRREVRRIVQTPGGITVFNDVGQGQAFQRNIVMNGSPHLPPDVRQWWDDSRGHWEGNTLVMSELQCQVDFFGSRGNMHVVERYARTGPNTIEHVVTMEDPKSCGRSTVGSRPMHRI